MKYIIVILSIIIIILFAIATKKPISFTKVESIQKEKTNDSQFKYLIVKCNIDLIMIYMKVMF